MHKEWIISKCACSYNTQIVITTSLPLSEQHGEWESPCGHQMSGRFSKSHYLVLIQFRQQVDDLQIKTCYPNFSLRKLISIQIDKDAMWAKSVIGGVFYREIDNKF